MDSYDEFLKNKEAVEKRRKEEREKYLSGSKDRLYKICSKKIDTTMIGAISAYEDAFRHIFEGATESEKIVLMEAFDAARSKVLDNGNNQKRNMNEEFKQYTIEWNRYSVVMPVKQRNKEG